MSKHTPGPWSFGYDSNYVTAQDGQRVAAVINAAKGKSTQHANGMSSLPTIEQLSAMIGDRAVLAHFGLDVDVVVVDVKLAYGNVRFLVEPVAGSKRLWVDIRRLNFEIDPFA